MATPPSIDTLILGAGPAGMSCAMQLQRHDKRLAVVERESQVGGMARTLRFGQFRTDIGPHRFFSKNQDLYEFIEGLLGEQWIVVPRFTRFYVDGKYYSYPIQMGNVLKNMGPVTALRIIRDYAAERIKALVGSESRDASFENYVVSRFGRTLAQFNMLNYTEKIWGIPCSDISADWAAQRISSLSIWSAVRAAFIKNPGPKTLVDHFYYPDLGTGLIYEAIQERLTEADQEVLLNSQPCEVRHHGHMIRESGRDHARGQARLRRQPTGQLDADHEIHRAVQSGTAGGRAGGCQAPGVSGAGLPIHDDRQGARGPGQLDLLSRPHDSVRPAVRDEELQREDEPG